MPREVITLQVGQCGNQLGSSFWDVTLAEHASGNKKPMFDEAFSTFFRNVDARSEPYRDIPLGPGYESVPLKTLKARCVMVDTEEGVLNEINRGSLRDLFDPKLQVRAVSGSGNNWAQGFEEYGPQLAEQIRDTIRAATECCDSIQAFFPIMSLGGGTGSGLGTYILSLLEDDYPGVCRFASCVFPSGDDDVITAPYNSMLALDQLIDHADCVLPVENDALHRILQSGQTRSNADLAENVFSAATNVFGEKKTKPFDHMNRIAASVLSHLTCSMRFGGDLNVDLGEIVINLVPFPRTHFLISSLAPTRKPKDVGWLSANPSRAFSELIEPGSVLTTTKPMESMYLAMGIIVRGDMNVSDLNRNIAKLRSQIRMPAWNEDGFKVGHCSAAMNNLPYSLLGLANNCSIRHTFKGMIDRFQLLYRKKAHVHHYTDYIDKSHFDDVLLKVKDLVADYEKLETRGVLMPEEGNSPQLVHG